MSKKNKQKQPKRKIKINGLDKEINLAKVVQINLENTDKEFIYIEKMKSGDWRFAYTSNTISDISLLKNIEIIRED